MDCEKIKPADLKEWHEIRGVGIGGSDAGTVLGVNDYKTQLQLYLEKRGILEPEDLSGNAAVHFGIKLEQLVADEYSERTGRKVRKNNFVLRHKKHKFMLANIDRDVTGEPRLLECKTAGRADEWGEAGTDEIPAHYFAQVMHYMGVTGHEVADVAVLIGGRDFRIYTVERDEGLIKDMIEIEADFWARVLEHRPPAPDYAARSTRDLLKRYYPGTDGSVIHASGDLELWAATERKAAEEIKAAQALRDEALNHIYEALGNGAILTFDEGFGYTRAVRTRKGYTVEPKKYIDVRYSAKAGEKAAKLEGAK